jgi:hypothetical protein
VGQFGDIRYWNLNEKKLDKTHEIYVGGRTKEFKEGQFHFVTYPWRRDLEKYLDEAFHLEYLDLLGPNGNFYKALVNTRFYAELEKRINEERIRQGVPLE